MSCAGSQKEVFLTERMCAYNDQWQGYLHSNFKLCKIFGKFSQSDQKILQNLVVSMAHIVSLYFWARKN